MYDHYKKFRHCRNVTGRKYISTDILPLKHMYYETLRSVFWDLFNGTPLQYSCLENPMDGEVWWATVHGVAKSRTRLSDFLFTFHFHPLEKEMATHSSVLAWRILGTGEPGGLPSMGSHRVGHDWSDLAAAVAAAYSAYTHAHICVCKSGILLCVVL